MIVITVSLRNFCYHSPGKDMCLYNHPRGSLGYLIPISPYLNQTIHLYFQEITFELSVVNVSAIAFPTIWSRFVRQIFRLDEVAKSTKF